MNQRTSSFNAGFRVDEPDVLTDEVLEGEAEVLEQLVRNGGLCADNHPITDRVGDRNRDRSARKTLGLSRKERLRAESEDDDF